LSDNAAAGSALLRFGRTIVKPAGCVAPWIASIGPSILILIVFGCAPTGPFVNGTALPGLPGFGAVAAAASGSFGGGVGVVGAGVAFAGVVNAAAGAVSAGGDDAS